MKLFCNLLELEIDALPEAHRQRLHSLRIAFEEQSWELPSGPARQAFETEISEMGGIVLARLTAYFDGIDAAEKV